MDDINKNQNNITTTDAPSWTIEFDAEHKVVITAHNGMMNAGDYAAEMQTCVRYGIEYRTNLFMIDCQGIVPSMGTIDALSVPRFLNEFGVAKDINVALIDSSNRHVHENLSLFVTVAMRNGYTVKLFPNREKALDWLVSSTG